MPGIATAIAIGLDRVSAEAGEAMQIFKHTKTYADLSAAGLTNNITLFTLGAGQVIHMAKIKHSISFGGGAIASYTISLGIATELAKYATAFNVFQAVAGDTMQLTELPATENHDAAVAVKIAAVSTGANLNAATAGSVDVWFWISNAL
jgi:hypothetical protein